MPGEEFALLPGVHYDSELSSLITTTNNNHYKPRKFVNQIPFPLASSLNSVFSSSTKQFVSAQYKHFLFLLSKLFKHLHPLLLPLLPNPPVRGLGPDCSSMGMKKQQAQYRRARVRWALWWRTYYAQSSAWPLCTAQGREVSWSW